MYGLEAYVHQAGFEPTLLELVKTAEQATTLELTRACLLNGSSLDRIISESAGAQHQ